VARGRNEPPISVSGLLLRELRILLVDHSWPNVETTTCIRFKSSNSNMFSNSNNQVKSSNMSCLFSNSNNQVKLSNSNMSNIFSNLKAASLTCLAILIMK
jgi:hypothetical protein